MADSILLAILLDAKLMELFWKLNTKKQKKKKKKNSDTACDSGTSAAGVLKVQSEYEYNVASQ